MNVTERLEQLLYIKAKEEGLEAKKVGIRDKANFKE